MTRSDRFGQQVAIVTGAGSGLGRATARRLAGEGAAVAAVDIDGAGVEGTLSAIEGAGGSAAGWSCDVSDPEAVRRTVAGVAERLGRPEVLVNCAGICRFNHTAEVSYETWRRTIDINLGGTFLMCQAVLPHMLDGGGAIVNVASNAGLQGIAYAAAYSASKGGVVLLTKALSRELAGTGVRVNAVAPGGMTTPMLDGLVLPPGADGSRLPQTTRLERADPDEVAGLILFLCAGEGRFAMGSVVSFDGGLTA